MHPELWTVPGINFTIRSYGFICLVVLLRVLPAGRREDSGGNTF